jgi:glucosamine--fructose-6-phosphate aminotransferase (isomerizing)
MVRYEKTLSHVRGIRERSSRIIAVANEGDSFFEEIADEVLYIPPASDLLLPILEIVPLQLLAYHIAVLRGNDVDHPRHLVKSVRTE